MDLSLSYHDKTCIGIDSRPGEQHVNPYAFDELRTLVNNLPRPIDDRAPEVRYLCALFAELAYYHIPQWELDNKKRAKLVPCEAYHELIARGRPTNMAITFRQFELPNAFAVANRGVVAVGILINRLLFIGFRGTQFLFDWRVNLRSRLIPIHSRFRIRPPFVFNTVSGRLHSGFAEESTRISVRVLNAIHDLGNRDFDHVFITGHSLGGAIAAIAQNFIKVAPTSACIFAAPRYSDLSAYISLPEGPPAQIRRPGDIVPTIPPKLFGYADHPYEFATDGVDYVDPEPYASTFGDIVRWLSFLAARFEPHSIELYRKELGTAAGAQFSSHPLLPVDKLSIEDIAGP